MFVRRVRARAEGAARSRICPYGGELQWIACWFQATGWKAEMPQNVVLANRFGKIFGQCSQALMKDESSWVAGQVMVVDGGATAR